MSDELLFPAEPEVDERPELFRRWLQALDAKDSAGTSRAYRALRALGICVCPIASKVRAQPPASLGGKR